MLRRVEYTSVKYKGVKTEESMLSIGVMGEVHIGLTVQGRTRPYGPYTFRQVKPWPRLQGVTRVTYGKRRGFGWWIRPLEDKRGAALQAGTAGKARASLSKILDAPSMWERWLAELKRAYPNLVDFTCLALLYDFENPTDLSLYIVALVINNKHTVLSLSLIS